MEYKNLSAPFSVSNAPHLAPIYTRNQKATVAVDSRDSDILSQSTASTTNTATAACNPASLNHPSSPTRRLVKLPYDTTKVSGLKIRTNPTDAIMHDLSSPSKNAGTCMDMIEPLNMVAVEQLGEPDPTAISKHDLLSAMAFDRKGSILSVGDRGGRVICFQIQHNAQGVPEYEYLTEFQAHTKSFDVLSSHEISETVTNIEWINASQSAQPALLTSNSRGINLFRIVDKKVRKAESIKKKM